MLSVETYHIGVLIIIILGLYNIMTSKNIVKAVLIVEMMLAATNLLILQASIRNGQDPMGPAVIITSIVIGAGLSAFLLSLAVKVAREHDTLDLRDLKNLRG